MSPESSKTRKIICQDKVCHVSYFVEAGAEQCCIRSANPDELCQEMPVAALTGRLKFAKRSQCPANNFCLLGNTRNVHHATGHAQSQFRWRINLMQKRCRPPENTVTFRWFTKLVVNAFKTNIKKTGVPSQVDRNATGEGCISREENLPWTHKAFGLVGDTEPFVSCQLLIV